TASTKRRKRASRMPRYVATTATQMITTAVAWKSACRSGQLTLRSSATTSERNRDARWTWTALVTEPVLAVRACCVGRGREGARWLRLGGRRRAGVDGGGVTPLPVSVCVFAGRMRAMDQVG